VAIVKDGKVVMAKGWHAEDGEPTPVDEKHIVWDRVEHKTVYGCGGRDTGR
jgi:hypothetical protein